MAPSKTLGYCNVPGCDREATGRQMCNVHYQRWYKRGSTDLPRYEDRLKRRLLAKYRADNNGCWIWTGSTAHYGHGIISVHGKHALAHRISWTLHHGPIPDGVMICHKCDVPACINPDHLYVGNAKTNSADMVSRNRIARGETSGTAKLTAKQVIAIRKDDRTRSDIAADFGVSTTMVNNIKSGKAWRHLAGEVVPAKAAGKITAEIAAEIRDANGRQVDIAERYGVSQVLVSQIKRGKAWAEVEEFLR